MGIDGKIGCIEKKGVISIINIDYSFSIVSTVMSIIEWALIGFLAFRVYKKLSAKPKVWKVILAIFVGLFSFTINMEWFHTFVKIPILPLGVWILYAVLNRKEDRWDTYRKFAWIGFLANFIFLAGTLLTIPVQSLIYPESHLSTYISGTKEASVNVIHPSGEGRTLDQEELKQQLSNNKQVEFESWQWFDEAGGRYSNHERFPLQLVGTKPKWGSGLEPDIYVEQDGKGILISTRKTQYYYHFPETVLKEAKR
ncbi:hypothetical protein [Rossellomorea vietnamensis]|uniref:hypothetical protein n=1 Tax=Rossellomorea vietnamensis TaxID=218284 RepID=UPI00308DEF65|nr:hypothetical protein Q7C14_11485 [Rossellomorea vietnamensis]WQI97977.1 hypothetical protein Q7C14_11530 [Rossellomorea vietnamensis]